MSTTRRTFLSTAALAPAAASTRVRSAGDRINIGLIGTGGRGRNHIADLTKLKESNVTIAGVCDIYGPHREAAVTNIERAFGKKPRATVDYREMLAWEEIDAVILAAPDFTHSQMLADAIEAGKDVYCEKPMGTKFDEARRAYLAVKNSKQIVQIGTQRRSDPGLIGAAAAMRSGAIGQVTRVDMEVHMQEARWKRDFSMIKQEDLDWPRFLFGRSDRPFDAGRFRQWQLFLDYTNGIPGLWMSHFIDLVPWFLDDPFPQSVVASGGVYLWKDGRETSDVFDATLTYPKGFIVRFSMTLTNDNGGRNLWYGTRGTLDAEALTITGAGSKRPDRVIGEVKIAKEPVESHMENWLRCIRSRQTPRADIHAGFSHAVAGCMAAEALRTERRVHFDPTKLEML
ncbi:MAG: Gfo/Idh/MocA family oxidoreductase [Bryobacterales bacterium]|nr:Gfo/Idh/MocA family oxidoreductase [Bryobacterales bacterium]